VLLPEATKPTSNEPTRTKRRSLKTLSAPFETGVAKSDKKDAVFNDGAADPAGRFLFGTKATGDKRAAELFK
jgi:sugar lactone lactonase YvrE